METQIRRTTVYRYSWVGKNKTRINIYFAWIKIIPKKCLPERSFELVSQTSTMILLIKPILDFHQSCDQN